MLSSVATWCPPRVSNRAPRGMFNWVTPVGKVPTKFSWILPFASRKGRGIPNSSPSRLKASPVAVETKVLSYMLVRDAQVRASSSAETSSSLRMAEPELRSRSFPNNSRARASFSANRRAKGLAINPSWVMPNWAEPEACATAASIARISAVSIRVLVLSGIRCDPP